MQPRYCLYTGSEEHLSACCCSGESSSSRTAMASSALPSLGCPERRGIEKAGQPSPSQDPWSGEEAKMATHPPPPRVPKTGRNHCAYVTPAVSESPKSGGINLARSSLPSCGPSRGPRSIATPGEGGPSSRCEVGERGLENRLEGPDLLFPHCQRKWVMNRICQIYV